MRILSVSLICSLCVVIFGNYVNKGSSFAADAKTRHEHSEELLKGGAKKKEDVKGPDSCDCDDEDSGSSGSGASSGFGSGCCDEDGYSDKYGQADLCVLFKHLIKTTPDLVGHETQAAWVKLIDRMQEEIIFDSNLSDDEKLVRIQGELDVFTSKYPQSAIIINYIYINEWVGYEADLEELAVNIQYSVTEVVIELDSQENCLLFDGLRNASKGDSALEARVQTLINSLTVILKGSEAYSAKIVKVYSTIYKFFEENSKDKTTILAGEIEEYGPISVFYSVSAYYWRIANFAKVIGGDAKSCSLIKTLTEAYKKGSTGSRSQRGQIKQLAEKLTAKFEKTSVIEERVKIIKNEFYQFLILQEWAVKKVFSLELDGYGSIGQLIKAAAFEESSDANSGSCSSATQLIITGSNSNTSLTISLQEAINTWTETQKQRFSAYFKRIINIQKQSSGQDCIDKVVTVFNQWTRNNTEKQRVYDVVVSKYESNKKNSKWGTVKQFCSCAKS